MVTVEQLIKALSEFPPELPVVVHSLDYGDEDPEPYLEENIRVPGKRVVL